jgi:predicted AlkP superfamily pyrophosphatase or phosphodiesterase
MRSLLFIKHSPYTSEGDKTGQYIFVLYICLSRESQNVYSGMKKPKADNTFFLQFNNIAKLPMNINPLKIVPGSVKYMLFSLLSMFAASMAFCDEIEKPRLILMITIDQLRGDMPWKLKDRFSPKGFRYLMDHGTVFKKAHYNHSNTLTAVGHATIFTGASTAQHGMPGNRWYDQNIQQTIYCVGDKSHLTIDENVTGDEGTSPVNLTSDTIGDVLITHSEKTSRVFSVSLKDRGAIIPGGRLGKAFWYSPRSGRFISSTYYFDSYPDWVVAWNNEKKADKYKNIQWQLSRERASYHFANQDNRPYEKSYKKLGRTFPHTLSSDAYSELRFTPMADELTLSFVKTLVESEKVGLGPHTDMLAVSFSATDYIGHLFGPNSLEAEDNLLRLDKTLENLFNFIDSKVGLENILIVLSSDHGTDAIPEHRISQGQPGGRHYPRKLIDEMNALFKKRYSIPADLIVSYLHPSVYLNLKMINKFSLDIEHVEKTLAEEIVKTPGIAFAVTKTDLLKKNLVTHELFEKIQNAFHPTRSGNVLIVQEQFWYLNEDLTPAAVHGSPYAYDTHVPIMIAGKKINHRIISEAVNPGYIAATVATYLNIPIPSGSTGQPLPGIFSK